MSVFLSVQLFSLFLYFANTSVSECLVRNGKITHIAQQGTFNNFDLTLYDMEVDIENPIKLLTAEWKSSPIKNSDHIEPFVSSVVDSHDNIILLPNFKDYLDHLIMIDKNNKASRFVLKEPLEKIHPIYNESIKLFKNELSDQYVLFGVAPLSEDATSKNMSGAYIFNSNRLSWVKLREKFEEPMYALGVFNNLLLVYDTNSQGSKNTRLDALNLITEKWETKITKGFSPKYNFDLITNNKNFVYLTFKIKNDCTMDFFKLNLISLEWTSSPIYFSNCHSEKKLVCLVPHRDLLIGKFLNPSSPQSNFVFNTTLMQEITPRSLVKLHYGFLEDFSLSLLMEYYLVFLIIMFSLLFIFLIFKKRKTIKTTIRTIRNLKITTAPPPSPFLYPELITEAQWCSTQEGEITMIPGINENFQLQELTIEESFNNEMQHTYSHRY